MAVNPDPFFKVIKQPANGTRIAGKRRQLNEVFQAPEVQVRFQVLEGLLAVTDSTGVPTGQADFSNPGNSGTVPAT